MFDFHLAPWRPYKGVLAAVVVLAPFVYYVASSGPAGQRPEMDLGYLVVRIALPWVFGWFLILFGDGTFGGMVTRSLRGYYVVLGIAVLALPSVRAWVHYDLAAIRSTR